MKRGALVDISENSHPVRGIFKQHEEVCAWLGREVLPVCTGWGYERVEREEQVTGL